MSVGLIVHVYCMFAFCCRQSNVCVDHGRLPPGDTVFVPAVVK